MGKVLKPEVLKQPFYKAVRYAHVSEHPIHLVYFFAIATNMQYALVAVVCLVVGVLCMFPVKVPLAEEEENTP